MAKGRITKKTVDGLVVTDKDYVHWDGELTGFGVRVRPSGAKSFVAVYRAEHAASPRDDWDGSKDRSRESAGRGAVNYSSS
jgi:hypothetical protein